MKKYKVGIQLPSVMSAIVEADSLLEACAEAQRQFVEKFGERMTQEIISFRVIDAESDESVTILRREYGSH